MLWLDVQQPLAYFCPQRNNKGVRLHRVPPPAHAHTEQGLSLDRFHSVLVREGGKGQESQIILGYSVRREPRFRFPIKNSAPSHSHVKLCRHSDAQLHPLFLQNNNNKPKANLTTETLLLE